MNNTCQIPSSFGLDCSYVRNHTDLCEGGGYLSYTQLVYCVGGETWWPAVLSLSLILLAELFLALSVSADAFLVPCLDVIVEHLKISENIAGVTFLAFGNGAPDIFSSIASVLSTDKPKPGLAFGALLGAGVFLTTVIPALITLINPFDVMRRPLIRDILFYLVAVAWSFYIFYKGVIRSWEAIGFICLYVLYALVVVIGRYIKKSHLDKRNVLSDNVVEPGAPIEQNGFANPVGDVVFENQDQDRPRAPSLPRVDSILEEAEWHYHAFQSSIDSEDQPSVSDNNEQEADTEYLMAKGESVTLWQDLWQAARPFSAEEWRENKCIARMFSLLRAPVVLVLNLTVPLVNPDKPNHNWSKPLAVLQCFLCPIFALAAAKQFRYLIAGVFPLWPIFVALGLALAASVYFLCESRTRPKYHNCVAYVGFLISVLWIYSLAREVVGIVTMIGAVTHLSNDILGLTLLAWSNSLGDLIADLSVARQRPRMAISACFGGPLFNLLLGIGISYSVATLQSTAALSVPFGGVPKVLLLFLCWSLLSSLVLLPLSRFRVSRPYGVYLVIIYVSFLVIVVLTEQGIIIFPDF